mgnify:CR=1 FL=1
MKKSTKNDFISLMSKEMYESSMSISGVLHDEL